MALLAHGIDLVDIARFKQVLDRHPDRMRERCFTQDEISYACMNPKREAEHLAARFAVKEAVLKALGTGVAAGCTLLDVETIRDPDTGRPSLHLMGKADELAKAQGLTQWQISISHTSTHAMASVVAM